MKKKAYGFILVKFVCLLLISDVCAQKKFVLEMNAGMNQPITNDISKTINYPINFQYLSRRKFEHTYFSLLPNLSYRILNPNILIGVQSGMYAHFNEGFFGYRIPVFITVPLMITARGNIVSIKSNNLGINLAGGKNFFSTRTEPIEKRNGILINASIFYLIKQKHIFKIGFEKQVDNSFFNIPPTNSTEVPETFEYKVNRISAFISYGLAIKKF